MGGEVREAFIRGASPEPDLDESQMGVHLATRQGIQETRIRAALGFAFEGLQIGPRREGPSKVSG